MAEVEDILTDPRLTVFGLFLEAGDAIGRRINIVYKKHRITARDFSVMMRVSRSEDSRLNMKDLAAQTGTSTSGITTVVDRLVESGLAQRELSAEDRRAWWVTLTDAGNTKVREIATDVIPVMEDGFFQLIGDDSDQFTRVLRRLRDGLHPEATSGGTRSTIRPAS